MIGQCELSPLATSITSASPELRSIAAMHIASPPEEHAVLTVKLGPCMPYAIAICAAPRFPSILGRKRGLTFFFPSTYACSVSAISEVPLSAVAITMPTLSDSASISMPLCSIASFAEAKAYCMKVPVSLASLGDM